MHIISRRASAPPQFRRIIRRDSKSRVMLMGERHETRSLLAIVGNRQIAGARPQALRHGSRVLPICGKSLLPLCRVGERNWIMPAGCMLIRRVHVFARMR